MPVAVLNNVATSDDYSDSLTVVFAFPRPAFSVQIYNAGVYYQIAVLGPADREPVFEHGEHFVSPSTGTFNNPVNEGFQPNTKFAGIRFRSSAIGTPARITVA